MKLLFVHGWSVTNTDTYGVLPDVLAKNYGDELDLDIEHISLGQYISFKDEVRMCDIVRAFDHAYKEKLEADEEFACITHSTGAPVIREWINTYYGATNIQALKLKQLIMLAPANHGSALAQLGKARLGRVKAWFDGIEPGQGVLDWLELGSTEQWKLNSDWLTYQQTNHFFPFVITGQSIDKKFYDHVNSYTAEQGTDGVVRVAAANLNYRKVTLLQNPNSLLLSKTPANIKIESKELEIVGDIKKPLFETPLEVLPNTSHSQKNKGIMGSVTKANYAKKQVVSSIVECLKVKNNSDYTAVTNQMRARTEDVQSSGSKAKYTMVTFRITDTQGMSVNDFDVLLLAGNDYMPDQLPKGFYVDHQKNKTNDNALTYYLNFSKLSKLKDGKIGFRIRTRPEEGFVYYESAEFRSNDLNFTELFVENQTLLVNIVLNRCVSENTFVLSDAANGNVDFKKRTPVDAILYPNQAD